MNDFALIFGVILLVLLVVAFFVALFVFWLLMIVDCAKRDFKEGNMRVVWIIVLVFLGIIGAIIYYFAVKRG